MYEKGKSMNKIAEDLGISRHAVQDAVKRFEETGSNKDRPHLFPWTETIFGEDPWTFQQDGAPAHKAYEVQEFLRDNCPDVITVDPHWVDSDDVRTASQ
uniref:Transposase n=1 Tax=Acrobeloides nanus TaxID=290746 RepID=A0A914BXN2_9BILA